MLGCSAYFFFFFNDTATTEIYTLSLHDALPILRRPCLPPHPRRLGGPSRHQPQHRSLRQGAAHRRDRKSTRLNSSHANISYAVFCLKKKNKAPPRQHSPPLPDTPCAQDPSAAFC